MEKTELERHFEPFRKKIIGIDQTYDGDLGPKKICYADWTASGRLYEDIEHKISHQIGPFVANTHTETSYTGQVMTFAYKQAKKNIKQAVGAGKTDVLISSNSGMTGVINKFQRILGLKIHEKFRDRVPLTEDEKPVVFCTHMEHHSNQTSWLETICDVVVVDPNDKGLVDLEKFEQTVQEYAHRPLKIAAVTSCSNVTGIITPYHDMAEIMHKYDGLCFVDFACSAPYIDICMRPEKKERHLDAIYFSPHKFLGGPGSSGILVFCSSLYKNTIPDNPGGGTVKWTNPWGEYSFFDEIEDREDGGTPAFLQTMQVALCFDLKAKMSVEKILAREHEQAQLVWEAFDRIPNLHAFATNMRDRLNVFSFFIEDLHYNLAVKLLSDRYGIQVRGGCSCAGTYGHYLFHISHEISHKITDKINLGNSSDKPGWIRMSLHPTMTNQEVKFILNAIQEVCINHKEWSQDYEYRLHSNDYIRINSGDQERANELINGWLSI